MSLGYQKHTKAMCRAYWHRELKKLKQTKTMNTPSVTCDLPPITDQFTPPPVTRHLPPIISPSGKDDFGFKQFQLEDYARGGLHDGLILGHDTGGGKSLALFVWPALKVGFVQPDTFLPGEPRGLKPLAPVLLVVPGDLHHKTIHEDAAMLKARVTVLDSQAAFLRLSTPNVRTGKRELPAGYYLTSYTQLTGNGVTPFPAYDPGNPVGMMQILGLTDNDSAEYFDCRDSLFDRHYRRLNALPTMTLRELSACLNKEKLKFDTEAIKRELQRSFDLLEPFHCDVYNPSFSDLPPEKKATVRAQMVQVKYEEFAGSIGEERWYGGSTRAPRVADDAPSSAPQGAPPESECNGPSGTDFKIKCVYCPSLADLCQDAFAACAVDEGTKMKGEETVIGTGVRQITATYKLVLTATPIKNRLPDVFRLAWWATGGKQKAHARFPYPDSTAAREQFAGQFLVSERNLTKEAENGKSRRFKKLTPQVCNVHRLWKMFAPIILRRRKANFGEDIVTKTRHVVRAPLGKEQADVYKFHLNAKYRDKNGGPAIGAQLQALRVAAANSASELLVRPYGDGTEGEPRAKKSYIPKLHSALKLIQQCLEKGEQAVVFSAFHDSLDILSARLTEAGVPHCIADGRTSQKRRGHLAAQFKLGPGKAPHQVLLAGVECMAEGHSFPLCNNVILLAYSWAYDKFEQAINRVHRLNSRWNVTVYAIICERSIDRKLEAMVQEKGDACELVLDGHLIGEQSEEVNLAELLEIAKKEFEEGGQLLTVDEKKLEKEWPPLRSQLSAAAKGWRLRGLELLGAAPVAISLPELEAATVPPCPAEAEGEFHVPAYAPAPVLDIQGEDLTPFAGLPLFELP